MPTVSFTPDADPESTSVDGEVQCNPATPGTWADVHGGVSDLSSFDSVDGLAAGVSSDNPDFPDTPTGWQAIARLILLFDTSSIGPATISSAKLTITPYVIEDTYDGLTNSEPQLDVVGSSPASNTSLSGSDFANLGTTRYATGNDVSSFAVNTPFDIDLNATGIAAINTGGITKLGLRINVDLDNAEPNIIASGYLVAVGIYTAEDGTVGYRPTLTVVYTSLTPVDEVYVMKDFLALPRLTINPLRTVITEPDQRLVPAPWDDDAWLIPFSRD